MEAVKRSCSLLVLGLLNTDLPLCAWTIHNKPQVSPQTHLSTTMSFISTVHMYTYMTRVCVSVYVCETNVLELVCDVFLPLDVCLSLFLSDICPICTKLGRFRQTSGATVSHVSPRAHLSTQEEGSCSETFTRTCFHVSS